MSNLTDILNGDTIVWDKETRKALMDFLNVLAHTVENLESRIIKLEKEKNE
jgi:hypothetical protein